MWPSRGSATSPQGAAMEFLTSNRTILTQQTAQLWQMKSSSSNCLADQPLAPGVLTSTVVKKRRRGRRRSVRTISTRRKWMSHWPSSASVSSPTPISSITWSGHLPSTRWCYCLFSSPTRMVMAMHSLMTHQSWATPQTLLAPLAILAISASLSLIKLRTSGLH